MFRILFIVILLSFLASCKNNIDTINLVADTKKMPVETAKDIELTYSDSAKPKVRLTSELIERYMADTVYELFPKGVHVEFYNDSLKPESQLTSKYAIRYEQIGKMEAKNDVVVFNKKGEKLNTEHLIWDEQKQLIYTNAFVKITTGDEIIFGDGLESNQDFSKYKIKNIKGTINIKQEENNSEK